MFRLVCCAALLLATSIATGCHEGAIGQGLNTEVVLTSNNYRVIESGLRASDTGFRVFGIGPHAMYSKAIAKIRVLAELDGRPRALVNVTTDVTDWTIGIVGSDTLVITADVVEFTGPPNGK